MDIGGSQIAASVVMVELPCNALDSHVCPTGELSRLRLRWLPVAHGDFDWHRDALGASASALHVLMVIVVLRSELCSHEVVATFQLAGREDSVLRDRALECNRPPSCVCVRVTSARHVSQMHSKS